MEKKTEKVVYAENVSKWYSFETKNVIDKVRVQFDDNPYRHWWEKREVYDYDFYVYHNPDSGKYALIISFWDVKGKILGTPECGITKMWYVKEVEPNVVDGVIVDTPLTEHLKSCFEEIERVVPQKVCKKFHDELIKKYGEFYYTNETLVKL